MLAPALTWQLARHCPALPGSTSPEAVADRAYLLFCIDFCKTTFILRDFIRFPLRSTQESLDPKATISNVMSNYI